MRFIEYLNEQENLSYLKKKFNADIDIKTIKLPLNDKFTVVMTRSESTRKDNISNEFVKEEVVTMDHIKTNKRKVPLDPKKIYRFIVNKRSMRLIEEMVDQCKDKDDVKQIEKIIYDYNNKLERKRGV